MILPLMCRVEYFNCLCCVQWFILFIFCAQSKEVLRIDSGEDLVFVKTPIFGVLCPAFHDVVIYFFFLISCFVCLFGGFRPTREFFTHLEKRPVKGFKFWPMLGTLAIEQWGFFSVPHLLWHRASIYTRIIPKIRILLQLFSRRRILL